MTLIVICGATATGKSDLAVALAEKLGGQIINADSMQLYKGMDIGTAKLSMEERKAIPHHLIDVLSVREEASVAQYQNDARNLIDQLLEQSIPAIVVGGTGLYIKAILDDLNFPDTDPEEDTVTVTIPSLYTNLTIWIAAIVTIALGVFPTPILDAIASLAAFVS